MSKRSEFRRSSTTMSMGRNRFRLAFGAGSWHCRCHNDTLNRGRRRSSRGGSDCVIDGGNSLQKSPSKSDCEHLQTFFNLEKGQIPFYRLNVWFLSSNPCSKVGDIRRHKRQTSEDSSQVNIAWGFLKVLRTVQSTSLVFVPCHACGFIQLQCFGLISSVNVIDGDRHWSRGLRSAASSGVSTRSRTRLRISIRKGFAELCSGFEKLATTSLVKEGEATFYEEPCGVETGMANRCNSDATC